MLFRSSAYHRTACRTWRAAAARRWPPACPVETSSLLRACGRRPNGATPPHVRPRRGEPRRELRALRDSHARPHRMCDPTAALDSPHVRPYRRDTSQHAGATVCHKGHVSVRTMCVSSLSRYTRSSLTLNPCRSQNRFPPSFLSKATKATLLILSARSALSEASTSCVPMFR